LKPGHYAVSESINTTRNVDKNKNTVVWLCVMHGPYNSFQSMKNEKWETKGKVGKM
jgi:hypothetical protein